MSAKPDPSSETTCPSAPSEAETANQLPKLTPAEFRAYNRLAEHMDYFHAHFRSTWDQLYTACCNNKRPSGVSIRQFLNMGSEFISHLNTHHSIEEQYVFPMLASKMPEFRRGVHLLNQHKEIHKGMDRLEEFLEACRTGERELRLQEMKSVLDSFGKVLWEHLDDEVRTLGAENMRRYWTLEEMKRLRM
ncbi:hypothetical protein BGW36DRAFT_433059 [Talaromyces proteolyticus]|uniref:Hemerythrin-like domain-containing protein n=1 Tax=Talaromyces proteolyticus TaxID=1131652 RepID=A0AAD4KF15_9EURO|nr:uncharacterized protein BGW36DRAFT_433059 [Talaromyces proteolyticus]KAH8690104.1 hypothetical protein BGW36DRAFT_433059 [Talaromyces proteolyticus]